MTRSCHGLAPLHCPLSKRETATLDDDAFHLFLQKQKIALEPYTLPPGTPPVSYGFLPSSLNYPSIFSPNLKFYAKRRILIFVLVLFTGA